MCVLETTAKHLMRFGTTAVLPSISWISIPTSRLFSLNSDITSGFFSQSRPLLSIPLGLSREKFWRQKLFLCLVQIEINLCAQGRLVKGVVVEVVHFGTVRGLEEVLEHTAELLGGECCTFIHARTDLCLQGSETGWIPPSPWYLDCTEGVRGLYQA